MDDFRLHRLYNRNTQSDIQLLKFVIKIEPRRQDKSSNLINPYIKSSDTADNKPINKSRNDNNDNFMDFNFDLFDFYTVLILVKS